MKSSIRSALRLFRLGKKQAEETKVPSKPMKPEPKA